MTTDHTFRKITDDDFPMVASWLAEPHVATWWKHEATVEEVAVLASDPQTSMFIAIVDSIPIGVIQSYWVDDYPEHAESVNMPGAVGLDLFIGDPNFIGRGYGSRMIAEFVDKVVRVKYPTSTGVIADPDIANIASIRAFEKAGFTSGNVTSGEEGLEQLMVLTF